MCKWWDRIIWKQEDRVSIFTTFLGTAKIQEKKVSQTHQSDSLQATDGNFGQSFKDFPAALKVQCVHTHTHIYPQKRVLKGIKLYKITDMFWLYRQLGLNYENNLVYLLCQSAQIPI